jgi:hypothetical protein
MKLAFLIISICILLISCATNTVKEDEIIAQPFESYFSNSQGIKVLDSIDETDAYVKAADKAMLATINKSYSKGLAARLHGSFNPNDTHVYFQYYLYAYDNRSWLNLHNTKEPLKAILKRAVAVTVVYVIVDDSRAVSISNFYLANGYRYNSNTLPTEFNCNGVVFKADYPIGWDLKKAFRYMKKEID